MVLTLMDVSIAVALPLFVIVIGTKAVLKVEPTGPR
jgi:hypothetical protein